jgi:hypothetical protein
LPRRFAQLDRCQDLSPGFAEQVGRLMDDAVAGKGRVYPIRGRRAQPRQRAPVTKQFAHITQLPWAM